MTHSMGNLGESLIKGLFTKMWAGLRKTNKWRWRTLGLVTTEATRRSEEEGKEAVSRPPTTSSWCLSISRSRPEATGQGSPWVQSTQDDLSLPTPDMKQGREEWAVEKVQHNGEDEGKGSEAQTCWKARKLFAALVFQSVIFICSP